MAVPALTQTLLLSPGLVVTHLSVCPVIFLAFVFSVPLPLPGGSYLLLSSPGTSKGTSSQHVPNGSWCLKPRVAHQKHSLSFFLGEDQRRWSRLVKRELRNQGSI